MGGLEGYLVSEGLMGFQGRSEGSWVVWVLPLAGAGTEVLVVAWGRGEQVGRGRSVGRGSLTRMR